ncbi:MAG: glycosyltransferase family 39 protein, partial [Gammaproteobacteria bacterium]
ALRIALALRPGLWADEIFSLAMATGHSLEHPAAVADPALGDFVEPPQAETASDFRPYLQHDDSPAGPGRVIRAVQLSDTSPPLYYLLLNAWTRVAGTSDAALRLFSTLWAVASFPLLWHLGRHIGGRRAAWAACILFTFAPAALHYSAEGRMYSLVWFLGLALACLSLELARRGPRPHLLLLWGLGGAAGLLTHYFFAFGWLACFGWLWFHPHRVRRSQLTAVAALTGLIVLPWYLELSDSLGRWRITGDWLAHPLSWGEALRAPFILAWSLLSARGAWGGPAWADGLAAGICALIALVVLRQGLGPLLSRRRALPWLWVLAASVGPVLFDLFMGTNASTKARYALPGLPAAMLLAAFCMTRLPRRAYWAFLMLLLFAWQPTVRGFFSGPCRPWEPYREVAARLAVWAEASDLIIVHSIPSGVLGVARYLNTNAALASWIVQLGQRQVPEDMGALVFGRRKVALAKIHALGEPSPAEAWLLRHATLGRRDTLNVDPLAEVLYFRLQPSDGGRSAIHRPAWNRSMPSVPGTPVPRARRSAG